MATCSNEASCAGSFTICGNGFFTRGVISTDVCAVDEAGVFTGAPFPLLQADKTMVTAAIPPIARSDFFIFRSFILLQLTVHPEGVKPMCKIVFAVSSHMRAAR